MKNRATVYARSNSDRSPLYDVRNPACRVFGEDNGCEVMFRGRRWSRGMTPVIGPSSLVELRRGSLRYRPACLAEAGYACEGWWSQTGSNRRPHACKARALPAELWPRNQKTNAHPMKVVGLGRLELPTSRLSSARSNQLSYKPKKYRSYGPANVASAR